MQMINYLLSDKKIAASECKHDATFAYHYSMWNVYERLGREHVAPAGTYIRSRHSGEKSL